MVIDVYNYVDVTIWLVHEESKHIVKTATYTGDHGDRLSMCNIHITGDHGDSLSMCNIHITGDHGDSLSMCNIHITGNHGDSLSMCNIHITGNHSDSLSMCFVLLWTLDFLLLLKFGHIKQEFCNSTL